MLTDFYDFLRQIKPSPFPSLTINVNQTLLIKPPFNFQVKLHYTEKALRRIAQKAMAKNTGARGLRAILESTLTEAMYEVDIEAETI